MLTVIFIVWLVYMIIMIPYAIYCGLTGKPVFKERKNKNTAQEESLRDYQFEHNNSPEFNYVDYSTLTEVDSMSGREFEFFCAGLLENDGFYNIKVTPGSNDQGVDILAEKNSIKYAIQCKKYSSNVGNTPVQEVSAGKVFYNCHVGVVITNSYFTAGAIELARATGVLLWDREKLMELYPDPELEMKETEHALGDYSKEHTSNLEEQIILPNSSDQVLTPPKYLRSSFTKKEDKRFTIFKDDNCKSQIALVLQKIFMISLCIVFSLGSIGLFVSSMFLEGIVCFMLVGGLVFINLKYDKRIMKRLMKIVIFLVCFILVIIGIAMIFEAKIFGVLICILMIAMLVFISGNTD